MAHSKIGTFFEIFSLESHITVDCSLDHFKTGQKSVRKVKCTDFRCLLFRWLLWLNFKPCLNFQLWSDEIEVTRVECGENVRVKLKGVEETDISQGFVLCDHNNPIKSCRIFDAQVNNFQNSVMRPFVWSSHTRKMPLQIWASSLFYLMHLLYHYDQLFIDIERENISLKASHRNSLVYKN